MSNHYNITNELQNIIKNDLEDISDITVQNDTVCFNIPRDQYVKTILESNLSGPTPPVLLQDNKNVLVEFSSPNIAKPFHLGHLRSTIIGNCIANINSFLQNKVKRINYLGDWGTQIGFIQMGMKLTNIDSTEIQTNPIKALYKAYVTAHKLAETDSTIGDRARELFKKLELGDSSTYKDWQTFKDYTVHELTKIYKRIGVVFDEYHWESMYNASTTNHIINLMEDMHLLTLDNMNRRVIPISEKRNIPLIKSDGSTLYLCRDIAAAIDRFEKNKFDAMYYVVDSAQRDHFSNLVQILNKMNIPWADRIKHIQYGRVQGMSTRKGTAVFLEDILNEVKEIMRERQMKTHTTKVSLDETDDSSDILGVSGVIIHDLRQRRMKNYEFNWDLILNMKGDSGIKLQYTHCRLTSLEHNSGAILTTECDPSLLQEPEVDDLIILISKFDEVVLKSYEELEPCILTVYLFQLSNAISKAWKTLTIRGQPTDLGEQRLLLFHTSKLILAEGMKLLGLTPLEKM
ncbi:putative arginine--tRNA ligase, mitochondrial [Dufourea novaeangliae]|uniref:Probable arginine--tRNA ligase, mitochondrial n=2 Tax=Dufourea novaeangliae TaxID=178035 RepID=A0A154NWP0_DUFNO|nr:putative arginine--tRNA ligase, mitochondrial [Dufourea novaeangliae]